MEVGCAYREDLTTIAAKTDTTTATNVAAFSAENDDHVQLWLSVLQQGDRMMEHWNNGTYRGASGNLIATAGVTPHPDTVTQHLQTSSHLQHRKRKQSANEGFNPATNDHWQACVEGHLGVRAYGVSMTSTDHEAKGGSGRSPGPGTPLWPRGMLSTVWQPLSRACPWSPASPHWPRAFPFPPPPQAVQAAFSGARDRQCPAPDSRSEHHTGSFGPPEQHTGSLGLAELCAMSFGTTENCTRSLGSAGQCRESYGHTDRCTGAHRSTEQSALACGSTEQYTLPYELDESCSQSLGSAQQCALPFGSVHSLMEPLRSPLLDRSSFTFAGLQRRADRLPLQPWRQDSAEDNTSLSSWESVCASSGGNSFGYARTHSIDSTNQSSDSGRDHTLFGVSSCQSSVCNCACALIKGHSTDCGQSHALLDSIWQHCNCSHIYSQPFNPISTPQFNCCTHETIHGAEGRGPAARLQRPSAQLTAQLDPYLDSDTDHEDMLEAKAGYDQKARPSPESQVQERKGRGLKGPRLKKGRGSARTRDDLRGLRSSQQQRQATPLGPAGSLRQRVSQARAQILNDIRKRRRNRNEEQAMTARGSKGNKANCKFCKKNGEDGEVVSHHNLYDEDGRVQCPILRVFRCELCQATGDHAHTITYCPLKPLLSFDDAVALRRKMHQQNQRRPPQWTH